MFLSSGLLIAGISLGPSLISALTLESQKWPNITVGVPVNIDWKDANGPVEVQLLYNPLPDPIILADGVTDTTYVWTPAANLSNGMYQVKLKDDSASTYSLAFPLSGGVALGDKNPAMNNDVTPPSNVHGQLNHSLLNDTMPFTPFIPLDNDDKDWNDWTFMDGHLSRSAVIGLSLGLAAALAIFLVMLTLIWSYRRKYLEVLTKHGDLIRELYGDGGPNRRGDLDVLEFEVMPVILEAKKPDDEFDPEQAKKDEDSLRKRAEHEARVAKTDLMERWRREDAERAGGDVGQRSSQSTQMTEVGGSQHFTPGANKHRDEHSVWEQDTEEDAATLRDYDSDAGQGQEKQDWKNGKRLV